MSYPLPLTKLAQLMSTNAARIFGLYPQKGVILPGSDADLLIYDPEPEVVIRAEDHAHHRRLYTLRRDDGQGARADGAQSRRGADRGWSVTRRTGARAVSAR